MYIIAYVLTEVLICYVYVFFYALQEVLPDRKRVTTRSYLPVLPVDTDTGKNFTCVATNLAVPMGKRATISLNVHRKSKTLSSFSNIYEEIEMKQSLTH